MIERRELPNFSRQRMLQALEEFPREYAQIPPMHSAIKQDGKPLYEYARAGQWRERLPRAIVIREMLLDRLACARPVVRCALHEGRVHTGFGGGSGGAPRRPSATSSALRRLGVAPFASEPQWTFETLETMPLAQRLAALLPVDAALTDWRRLDLPADGVSAFRQGQTVSLPAQPPANARANAPENVRIYAAGLGFLGLGAVEPAGRLVPLRLISSA